MEDDEAPVLTPQQEAAYEKHLVARDALFHKKITPEQAKAQGYMAKYEEPWGMSELRPDVLQPDQSTPHVPRPDSAKPEWLRGPTQEWAARLVPNEEK